MKSHLSILLILLGILLAPMSAYASGLSWESALSPLENMPVQNRGYIRSGYTFAQYQLREITGKPAYKDQPALFTVLWLMSDAEARRTEPLIKVSHPDLAELFGSGRISLSTYREPLKQQVMIDQYRRNPEQWQKPVNELENRARMLENLPNSFTVVPTEKVWATPSQIGASDTISPLWTSLQAAILTNSPVQASDAASKLARAVLDRSQQLEQPMPRLHLDVFFAQHRPFAKSAMFYVLSALAFGAALIGRRPKLGWIGLAFMGIGLAEGLLGIGSRWVLTGRAPLSNMYESFTFAVTGMIMITLGFELRWKNQLAGVGGAILGFIFMVVAHNAPLFDTEIRPLMPALQSSWLAYHVITIMLSYSAFALAFFFALLYLAKDFAGTGPLGRVTGVLPDLTTLDRLNYRVIAVGFPLLTLGIVFGALWADIAWGRPWGFDPKETWSAITWVVYAIYLHARLLAKWQGRRAQVLSILGFVAVMFTYIGVNFLLPGLHSYA